MEIMTLLEHLLKQNPWWEGKKVEEIKNYKQRFLLDKIWQKHLQDPQIIAVLGLRRVGKTVLLWQIIEKLIKSKEISPKRILYFSFDEILGKDPDIIEKVLDVYENEVLKQDLKSCFIFLDEVNHLQNWQVILKRYYDLKKKIKFFVSGSSSIYLKKAKESLAGRLYEFELEPLGFREYLYLKSVEVEDVNLQRLTLKKELNKYFISGSLPEIINETDFSKIKKYIQSLVDKIIFYDIPKVYDIAEPEAMKTALSFIAQKPGMLLNYQSIASNLGLSYQTVSKYIKYLEKSYLIRRLYNFRGSPIARARKLKKGYLGSINLAAGFLDSEKELMQNIPGLAENLVCLHLKAKWFWKKYTEVDFYHKGKAIEVKYTETEPDLKNNILACKKLETKELLVITKDLEKQKTIKGIKMKFVPLWKWLLHLKS